MLTRLFRLVISILFVKGINSLQNDPNNLSNIINNAIGSQSQGIIQKSLNQIASNRGLPINLQQTLNARQPSSQQNQNSQQMLNFQAPVSSQPGNTQTVNVQSSFEQPSNGRQSKGYRQPLIVQRPASSSTTIYSPIDNNHQQCSNADQQNLNMGNIQQFQQQAPGTTSYFVQQQPTSQTYQGIVTDPFSTQTITIPMSNINYISDTGAVTGPQSQQPFAISGVPSYIIDRPQLSNCVHQPATTSTVNNQPSVTYYGVPQGQQVLDINQIEYPNQMLQPQNFQPQFMPTVNQQHFDNEIMFPSVTSQSLSPNTLTSLLSSSLASSLSSPGSKPSSLKALLPLILNILNERNNNHNCDCCQNCGCNQRRNMRKKGDVHEGCPKQKRHGSKQEAPLKHDYNKDDSVVFEDHNESERRTDDKKQPKEKKQKKYVKYEESYEEYDDDDY